jgi:adenylyltransferase/sulfurtransferase
VSVHEIEVDELEEILEGDAVLVDVREQEEVDVDSIDGMIHMPLSEFENFLDELPEDKDIVFYCRSGRRSLHAAKLAESRTGTQLYSLRGGIVAYREAGH